MESFIQFLLLFVQLYIPLTAAYWALFGGNEDNLRLIAESENMLGRSFMVHEKNDSGQMVWALNEEEKFRLTDLSQMVSVLSHLTLFY